MEKEIKICNLCKKNINLNKDSYVKLEDYTKGKFHSVSYYHNKCYLDRINKGLSKKTAALQNLAVSLVGRANKLMDNMEGKEKVYEIK